MNDKLASMARRGMSIELKLHVRGSRVSRCHLPIGHKGRIEFAHFTTSYKHFNLSSNITLDAGHECTDNCIHIYIKL